MTDTDTVERVAKAINGPRDAAHIGTLRLHELQDYKWLNQTTPQERIERLSAARAAIAALPPAVPQCVHMTAEMAQNCPTCNPSPFNRVATTPDPVSEAAKVLLDEIMPAEEHDVWYAAQDAMDKGGFVDAADIVIAALRALTKDGEAG